MAQPPFTLGMDVCGVVESAGSEVKGFREPGSNGLKPGAVGTLLLADQGNRAIAVLDLASKTKRILAYRFEGKRLNSPND